MMKLVGCIWRVLVLGCVSLDSDECVPIVYAKLLKRGEVFSSLQENFICLQ
jgi:hypothetical protein